MQKLFRDETGQIRPLLDIVEGITYRQDPLDFFILLARYKFAARLLEPSDTVLEIGCGHGLGSVMLSKFARAVTGVDIDSRLVEYCRETYRGIKNLTFEVADARQLTPLGQRFDTVVCLDVIEHFNQEEGQVVIQSLVRVLNERGMLIIGTPNVRSQEFASQRRKSTHLFEYDYGTFKALLSRAFRRALVFSMTDEVVSTGFSQLAWYFMGVCIK